MLSKNPNISFIPHPFALSLPRFVKRTLNAIILCCATTDAILFSDAVAMLRFAIWTSV